MTQQKLKTFWTLVRELEKDTLQDWRRQHAPGYTLGDALALYAEEVKTEVSRRIQGRHSVFVQVIPRTAGKSHDQYYLIERLGDDGYVLIEI